MKLRITMQLNTECPSVYIASVTKVQIFKASKVHCSQRYLLLFEAGGRASEQAPREKELRTESAGEELNSRTVRTL
jgi:hypothetical protein